MCPVRMHLAYVNVVNINANVCNFRNTSNEVFFVKKKFVCCLILLISPESDKEQNLLPSVRSI